jgi:hypothetical protein
MMLGRFPFTTASIKLLNGIRKEYRSISHLYEIHDSGESERLRTELSWVFKLKNKKQTRIVWLK